MPGDVADILRNQDERGSEFVLHAQAVLLNARRRVVGIFAVWSLCEERSGSWCASSASCSWGW